jgi:16S rRNA (uracil1498-N3)-methyltransferase
MHRFFVPPHWIQGNDVAIGGPQANQIAHVLRMRPGDRVVVLDNSGWELEVQLIAVARSLVEGNVLHRRLAGGEPRTKISLYQGVLKGKRFEYVLQKGTELGVVEFVPLIADRCVLSDLDAVEKKRRRWEWIIQEAAEQSRRGRKPTLRSAILFPHACERAKNSGGLSLIPWEGKGIPALRDVLRRAPQDQEQNSSFFTITIFIGPEGGFTTDEVGAAQRYGLVPVTLGPRILRAETAGLAAAAVILYELGDMS